MFGAVVLALGLLAAPPANAPVPRDPAQLAERLTSATAGLRLGIDSWTRTGNTRRGEAPLPVQLYALYQQRVVIVLSEDRPLYRRTTRRLPAAVAAPVHDDVIARRDLLRLSHPRPLSAFRVGRARPVGLLLRYYAEAQRRFGVAWQVLAAVNYVESAFGRLRNASSAGAQGPMQFLPSTWRAYGLGGNIHDPHDAILGAANYLHANGAPRNYRRALYRYNPSRFYVDAVLRYVHEIRRDRRQLYAYYSRSVFVRTPSGLRRLTGPR